MPLSTRFVIAPLAGLALLAAAPAGARPAAAQNPWSLCAAAAAAAGRAEDLPAHLLPAVAKIEAGRWHGERRATIAWPWTVTAEGEGHFLPSKPAAVALVRELAARGVDNVDVGCLQVNLHHHPEAFADLQEAFDPDANAGYAARFLARLRRAAGSWTRAIGDYHSQTPRLSGAYRLKVFRAWRVERRAAQRRAAAARRARMRLARSLAGPLAAGPLPADG